MRPSSRCRRSLLLSSSARMRLMAVSRVAASSPGSGVLYSGMSGAHSAVDGHDAAAQVAVAHVAETCFAQHVGQLVLRGMLADALGEVAVAVLVVGDQFAQQRQHAE